MQNYNRIAHNTSIINTLSIHTKSSKVSCIMFTF